MEGTLKKAKFLCGWALSSVWVVTLAAIVILACTDKNAGDVDANNYDDVPALAGEHYRAALGKCLEHHMTYADRMNPRGGKSNSWFAIARCSGLSASWTGSWLSSKEWGDPTAADLKACAKAARAYLRENHKGVDHGYLTVVQFYSRSVCIAAKHTAGSF